MKGQRVGYVRVSTFDQNVDRQLDGEILDRVFTDKASGKDVQRAQLDELLAFVREGDIVVVHSMDRLARNLDDLRNLVHTLTRKGVCVEFVKERLIFSDKDESLPKLMLSVMGAFAEFERSLIRERQREGIALAKKRGAYRGRKRVLSHEQVADILQRISDGETKAAIAREYGISRETLYQYLRSYPNGGVRIRPAKAVVQDVPVGAKPFIATLTLTVQSQSAFRLNLSSLHAEIEDMLAEDYDVQKNEKGEYRLAIPAEYTRTEHDLTAEIADLFDEIDAIAEEYVCTAVATLREVEGQERVW
ncbi:recombinase family protein [Neokomagataea anthophila]|uniref:Recombinase family protein n=1 Tax=Neokomagataea anthophila TaxID=2826925 RepID=A0ABS5E9C8_9PROT|nr:recombinase family protein [Neokomagataea anthophila]MBR0560507.1 recombinase family protein [Neokomagataea anthophila]